MPKVPKPVPAAETAPQTVKHTRVGRPQIWPTQINAPSEALALYAAIAALQDSDAFDTCHLWSGSMNGTRPVIKWQKKNKGVVQVLAGYMGLPVERNLCGVKNCVNPFHYTPYAAPEAQIMGNLTKPVSTPSPQAGLEDYIELVQDIIDKNVLKKEDISFETVRPLVDPGDISDAYLRDSLKQMGY